MQEDGGLFTMADLANWKVHIEEPLNTSYKGIEVYKLPLWQQGPAMLQALNILENTDVKSMGYNSPQYIHALYQAMNLAFADRDFYYGDPYFPPEEPVQGLLSKEYAKARFAQIDPDENDPDVKPGDPYPFQGGDESVHDFARAWNPADFVPAKSRRAADSKTRCRQWPVVAMRKQLARQALQNSSPTRRRLPTPRSTATSMPAPRRSRRPMRKAGSCP